MPEIGVVADRKASGNNSRHQRQSKGKVADSQSPLARSLAGDHPKAEND
jgi:hypothetical protein